jgi:hypothetical protein
MMVSVAVVGVTLAGGGGGGGGGGVTGGMSDELDPLLPQPIAIPRVQTMSTIPNMDRQLERRAGIVSRKMQARAAPPPERKSVKRFALAVAAGRTAGVAGVAELGLIVQVTCAGAVQERLTALLKPLMDMT